MDFFIAFGSLDQRSNGSRRSVKNADLVLFDHLPETSGVRVGRNAFKNNLGGTRSQRAISHVGVARDPANVGGAPEHVSGLDVEGPVHGQFGPQQVTAGAVLHAFGFSGGARGVKNEQRMLGTDELWLAGRALAAHDFMHQAVPPCHHVAGRRRALVNHHIFNRLAATHADAFVHNGLER